MDYATTQSSIEYFIGGNHLQRTQHLEKVAFHISPEYKAIADPFIKEVQAAVSNNMISSVDAQFIYSLLNSSNTLNEVHAIIEQCSSSLKVDKTLDTSDFRPVVNENLYTDEAAQAKLEA